MWYAIWFTNFSATVASTVHGITDGRSSSQPTFQNVVTNEGNAFSMTNGTFMAPRKGLYYFIFHLVKKRATPRIDSCSCVLYKNGASTGLRASIDPKDSSSSGGADIGSYGVSNGGYLVLETGNTVSLENCSGQSSFDSQSSFSGYLVTPM